MTLKLEAQKEERTIASIRRFFDEQLDHEIGDLKAALVLDYFIKEIGPSIYNQAIRDAQSQLQDRILDLDDECFQVEFGYWNA